MAALILCSTSLTAFCDTPPVTSTVQVETQAGSKENVTVNVSQSVTTDENGTNTKISHSADDFVTADGLIVDYGFESDMTMNNIGVVTGKTESSYTSQTADGIYSAEGGSETTREVVPFVLPAQVTIPLTSESGKNTAQTFSGTHGKTTTSGKEETDDTDGVYSYSTVISHSGGVITAQSFIAAAGQTAVHTDAAKLDHVVNTTVPENSKKLLESDDYTTEAPDSIEIDEGYDHLLVGTSHASHYWPAKLFTTKDKKGPLYISRAGVPYYGRAGKTAFEDVSCTLSRVYDDGVWIEGENGNKSFHVRYASAEQFLLVDKNGNKATAYCADEGTHTANGSSYIMENVEDATYYDPANAKTIQGIAYNGYWGTSDGIGSLAAFKNSLKESGKFTAEELDRITDGMALTATQLSIWKFSNHMSDVVFLGVYDTPCEPEKKTDADGNYLSNEASKEDSYLIYKIVEHLTTTDFDGKTENHTGNTVINARNFLGSAALNIKEVNGDECTTDVAFALKVRPRSTKDSLLVTITDGDGNVLAKGRLAGTVGDGEVDLSQHYRDGQYFFPDIKLQKGQVNNVKFHMTGWQDLDQGAYLYTSEKNANGGMASQTLVGLASGPRDVNVHMQLQFQIDIYDELLERQQVWRRERITPLPISDTVEGIKTLNGAPAAVYTFELKKDGSILDTATSSEDGSFSFDDIIFTEEGTFTYTVNEVVGSDPYTVYDESVFNVTYTVELQNRELVIVEKTIEIPGEDSGTVVETIAFENIKYTPAKGTIEGTKVFKGKSPKGYTFSLKDESGSEIATATSDKNGRFAFEDIEFCTPGTYIYTVEEKAGNNKKIIYDDTVYEVVFEVYEEEYTLTAEAPFINILKGEETTEADAIVFKNKLKPTPTPTPTPPVPPVPPTGDIPVGGFGALGASLAAIAAVLFIKRRINS